MVSGRTGNSKSGQTRPRSTKLKPLIPFAGSLAQQGAFLLNRRLGSCDIVNNDADAALGDNVGDAIPYLNSHNCMGAAKSNHWEDVHNWVCQPAHNSPNLGTLNHGLHSSVRLCV